MRNGLRGAREKRRLTQQQAADALGLTKSGYVKKEHGERGLDADFIRRACEVFGVNPDEIILELSSLPDQISAPLGEIDPEKLSSFVAQAKDRLASLTEIEAKNLVLALISAARTPPGSPKL